jgi:hypothetical protein
MKHLSKLLYLSPILLLLIVAYHNVPKAPTESDKIALQKIYPKPFINAQNLTFEEQVTLIQSFQKVLHEKVKIWYPIDYNHEREPSDLLENGGGLCYDFSRSIEKFLILNNFEVRHVAIYAVDSQLTKFKSFIKPTVSSHSLTEVKTKKGWLIVDSNFGWVSLNTAGDPISFKLLYKKDLDRQTVHWMYPIPPILQPFYNPCAFYVYGLYSRHGCFYPPYNPIPDVNLYDFVFHNFLSNS